MSDEKQTAGKALPSDNTPPVGPATSSPAGCPEGPVMESSPPKLDEDARAHYEALAQRIVDTYARFSEKDMELLKALGWG
jgi:hypothetical protein